MASGIERATRIAAYRTLKELIRKLNTAAGRKIRDRYNIKARDLKGSLRQYPKPSYQKLEAGLTISNKRISLYKFAPRPGGVVRPQRRPVSVIVLRKGGRKQIRGGFIAQVAAGENKSSGVFVRKPKGQYFRSKLWKKFPSRYPIEKKYGPTAAQMFYAEAEEELQAVLKRDLKTIMDRNLLNQLRNTVKLKR